jgi:multimeric flavodoxin WrbA
MFTIHVLGISGSPRKGNSWFLLEHALEAAKKVDPDNVIVRSYSFAGKKMGPCLSCFKCVENGGECVVKDDFQELRELWIEADVVLYSVPVYHMAIPGQLKCFIDRLGNSSVGYYNFVTPRRMKIIGAISQGMDIFAGQESCQVFFLTHAALMNCMAVSGDGTHSYIGAGGWTRLRLEKDALKKLYAEGEGDAEIAVKAAASVGQRTTEVAMMVKEGLYVHRERFKEDRRYKPILEKLEKDKKPDILT